MLSQWRIRYKLFAGVAALLTIVLVLSISSFLGVYSYRQLARSVSTRAAELPLAAQLSQSVNDLRVTLSRARDAQQFLEQTGIPRVDTPLLREEFHMQLLAVRQALTQYRDQLENDELYEPPIDDLRPEEATVLKIDASLAQIVDLASDADWMLDDVRIEILTEQTEELRRLAGQLPTFLHQRMHLFAGEARVHYRTLIALTWLSGALAIGTLGLLVWKFYRWVFRPLQVLVHGSRRVARGEFEHEIQLDSGDEMAELAAAMNDMTRRFCEIRDDLDAQVAQRTREVIRSERLASVGFLAAGVAHEINNPLAAIAMCAESLESRLDDVVPAADMLDAAQRDELAVVHKYLRRIQDEAFRCKGITSKLLDFSRKGDGEREAVDLAPIVSDVVEMVRHIDKYQGRQIEVVGAGSIVAWVNPQELKQVVLNLVTNSLEAVDVGGRVRVELRRAGDGAELIVTDDGCGMTEEVMTHLFDPFFTRRRDGQGTGLGLWITFLIVQDHHGTILVHSDGVGRGCQFRVTFPLAAHEKENSQAA